MWPTQSGSTPPVVGGRGAEEEEDEEEVVREEAEEGGAVLPLLLPLELAPAPRGDRPTQDNQEEEEGRGVVCCDMCVVCCHTVYGVSSEVG